MVGSNLELNMGVKVWNAGEDSYGTTVTFSYPPGLSYRRVAVSQVLFLLGRQAKGWGSTETPVQSSGWGCHDSGASQNPRGPGWSWLERHGCAIWDPLMLGSTPGLPL